MLIAELVIAFIAAHFLLLYLSQSPRLRGWTLALVRASILCLLTVDVGLAGYIAFGILTHWSDAYATENFWSTFPLIVLVLLGGLLLNSYLKHLWKSRR